MRSTCSVATEAGKRAVNAYVDWCARFYEWSLVHAFLALHNALKKAYASTDQDYDWPLCDWCGEEATTHVGVEGEYMACFTHASAYLGPRRATSSPDGEHGGDFGSRNHESMLAQANWMSEANSEANSERELV